MSERFSEIDAEKWKDEGAVLIPEFFTRDEMEPVHRDFDLLYADRSVKSDEAMTVDKDGHVGTFSVHQFRNFDDMPFDCSPALNLLGLHPELIALARAALETDHVHLYQSHSWAKYTGEADYEQPFHCDYKNHTLTVPANNIRSRTINIMIYVTDVTEAHGAIHYVPQPASDEVTGPDRPMFLENDKNAQHALKERELSGAGPAGSVFAYGIDVYHRGTNLTAPNAHRYTLTASYKAAGNDMIGWSAWPYSFLKPWHHIFDNATPEQLACLGVPVPGDPFWDDKTIRRTEQRWPGWNSNPYREAL